MRGVALRWGKKGLRSVDGRGVMEGGLSGHGGGIRVGMIGGRRFALVSIGGCWGFIHETAATELVGLIVVDLRAKDALAVNELSDQETYAEVAVVNKIVHGTQTGMIDRILRDEGFLGWTRDDVTFCWLSVSSSPTHLLDVVDHLKRSTSMDDERNVVVIVACPERVSGDHDAMGAFPPTDIHRTAFLRGESFTAVVKVTRETIGNLVTKVDEWNVYESSLRFAGITSGCLIKSDGVVHKVLLGRRARLDTILQLRAVGR